MILIFFSFISRSLARYLSYGRRKISEDDGKKREEDEDGEREKGSFHLTRSPSSSSPSLFFSLTPTAFSPSVPFQKSHGTKKNSLSTQLYRLSTSTLSRDQKKDKTRNKTTKARFFFFSSLPLSSDDGGSGTRSRRRRRRRRSLLLRRRRQTARTRCSDQLGRLGPGQRPAKHREEREEHRRVDPVGQRARPDTGEQRQNTLT